MKPLTTLEKKEILLAYIDKAWNVDSLFEAYENLDKDEVNPFLKPTKKTPLHISKSNNKQTY